MKFRSLALTTFAAASYLALAAPAVAVDLLYTLEKTATLPSTDTDWDYIKMEPGGNRLFMVRDKDGLTVFDVDRTRSPPRSATRSARTVRCCGLRWERPPLTLRSHPRRPP